SLSTSWSQRSGRAKEETMGTGMHKLIVVGTVVAALGLAGPAFGKPAMPEGYAPPSTEPSVYSPQALKALGERGQAMAQFYGQWVGNSQQALKALGERGEAQAQFYSDSSGYTPQAIKALGERGQAAGQFYGTAVLSSQLDAHQRQAEPVAGGTDANQ